MSDMVERATKAVFDAENGIDGDQIGDMLYESDSIVGDKDDAIARTMAVCRLAVLAVIAAMREDDLVAELDRRRAGSRTGRDGEGDGV